MGLHTLAALSLLTLLCSSNGDQPVEEEAITPEHVQALGGPFPVDVQGAEVQEAARKAVEELNKISKAKKYFKLLNITSAEVQVTNLITYRIETVIGKTKCLKSEDVDLETCVLAKKERQCEFVIAFDPRNETYELIESCKK